MRSIEVELTIAELAADQWGMFTAAQAQAAGITRVRLSRLAKAGVLLRLAHGVYVLRGAGGVEHLDLRAAWLALDPERSATSRIDDGPAGNVVSHASAAVLYGYGDLEADRHEFTTATRKQTRRTDIRLHRAALTNDDITIVSGLPITRPLRIIPDLLSARFDGEHIAGVLAAAVRAKSIDIAQLAPRLDPYAARFGFAANNGEALLDHLLQIGGSADQVAAEQIVHLARANNTPVAAWANAALLSNAATALEQINHQLNAAAGSTNWATTLQHINDQLNAAAGSTNWATTLQHINDQLNAAAGSTDWATALRAQGDSKPLLEAIRTMQKSSGLANKMLDQIGENQRQVDSFRAMQEMQEMIAGHAARPKSIEHRADASIASGSADQDA